MPAKTGKQYRAAAAACHGKGKTGMSKKVGCEMVKATPAKKRSSFSRGKRSR